jgi:hypothetical protein
MSPGRWNRGYLLLIAVVGAVALMPLSNGWCDVPRPLVAVIVDDLGYSVEMARDLARLPMPQTWAIIPYLGESKGTSRIALDKGIPFMLHLPMEAIGDGGKRHSLVWVGMPEESIRQAVRNALWSLPGVSGLNNHRGSRASEDREVMKAVLLEIAAEGLFFVDSRTSGDSVGYSVAVESGVPATLNRSFIDHEDSESFMWSQFHKAVGIARKTGGAVVICHARPGTLKFLPRLYEKASEDVQFVTVPEYLEQKRTGGWEE